MGSSKKQTVGYRYHMGLHFGLCQGPVDAFLELRGGDRTAWAGNVTGSGSIEVDAPDLWGGEKKEGGIQGTLDVMMGEPTQAPNDYLVSQLGTPMPAFRGMLSTAFRKGMVGAMNPYPKPWRFRLRRILQGWSGGAAWYPEKAAIPMSAVRVVGYDRLVDASATAGIFEDGFVFQGDSPEDDTPRALAVGASLVGESVGLVAYAAEFVIEAMDPEPYPYTYVGFWTGTETNFTDDSWLDQQQVTYRSNGSVCNVGCEPAVAGADFGPGDVIGCVLEFSEGLGGEVVSEGRFFKNGVPTLTIPGGSGLAYRIMAGTLYGSARIRVRTDPAEMDHWSAYGADDGWPGAVDGGLLGMNPAHIVYQALTDPEWGMGYPPGALDLDSFSDAADTFHGEGLGLCGQWTRQDTIEGFIQDMVNHAGAVLAQHPVTGLFQLLPIRGDYTVESLPEFRRGLNVQGVELFERAALTETVNEVAVQYIDAKTGKDGAVTIQHLANIQAQGGVVSQTVRYPFCPTAALAQRLALRDLTSRASPLCKVRLVCDRSAYGVVPGRVIRWTDAKLGIVDMPMRVLNVDTGTIGDGAIRLDLAEDVFGLPATTYMGQQEGGWVEPSTGPKASPAVAAFEAPYVALHRTQGASAVGALDPDSGHLAMVAAKPSGLTYGFALYTRADGAEYEETGGDEWAQGGILAADLGQHGTELELGAPAGMDTVSAGDMVMLGSGSDAELVRVDALDLSTSPAAVTVGRGCGDTVPRAWPVGTRLWVLEDNVASSVTEFVTGEVVDAKAATRAPGGELALPSSPGGTVTMAQRQARPYPPGLFRVNGETAPFLLVGEVAVTWAHRDRLLQADQLVDQEVASIGPEAGTTYTVRWYLDDVLAHTEAGITGTDASHTFSGDGLARIELESVRDGLGSWQHHAHEAPYYTDPPEPLLAEGGDPLTIADELILLR